MCCTLASYTYCYLDISIVLASLLHSCSLSSASTICDVWSGYGNELSIRLCDHGLMALRVDDVVRSLIHKPTLMIVPSCATPCHGCMAGQHSLNGSSQPTMLDGRRHTWELHLTCTSRLDPRSRLAWRRPGGSGANMC